MKQTLALQLRRLAGALWEHWRIEDLRYLSPLDLTFLSIVGRLDHLADRLDPSPSFTP